jgi:hypothetical protein
VSKKVSVPPLPIAYKNYNVIQKFINTVNENTINEELFLLYCMFVI